jgi:hypothetical protein
MVTEPHPKNNFGSSQSILPQLKLAKGPLLMSHLGPNCVGSEVAPGLEEVGKEELEDKDKPSPEI